MNIAVLLLLALVAEVSPAEQLRPDVDRLLRKKMGRAFRVDENLTWLPNSNKIGLGYNPLYGSPVCYTGNCQMDGFAQPVFKLNFTKQPQGACTSKFIPQFISSDCLPSMDTTADTDILSDIPGLFENMLKNFEISARANVKYVSFSYTRSHQTSRMIDKIYRENTTVIRTSAKISSIRLSMFEPKMDLSDEFVYVIEQMPCCNRNDADVERYIYDYVFRYFGYTYVNDLLLGGIAQQNIYIKRADITDLEKNGYKVTNEGMLKGIASDFFSASFNAKTIREEEKKKNDDFLRYVEVSRATKLGGDVSLPTIDEWSKTVSSNPVIIKFGVRYLFDLLTKKRFPDDKDIVEKAALIEETLEKYLNEGVYCYGNCSNNGVCQPTGYFHFGICKCHSGWTGVDCSLVMPKYSDVSVTVCSSETVMCVAIDRTGDKTCPDGWTYQNGGTWGKICHRKQGNIVIRTCHASDVPCEDHYPRCDVCPPGYRLFPASRNALSGITVQGCSMAHILFPILLCFLSRQRLLSFST